MILKSTEWKFASRPGYLGSRRDQKRREWDVEFGEGNWTLGWKIGKDIVVDYIGACILYEDAYFKFLSENTAVLAKLLMTASDVYDVDPSDVNSGFDYTAQQHGRTHIQDIAIRRVVVRMCERFYGEEPHQIRFHDGRGSELSRILTPGNVPFHRPDIMEPPLNTPHTAWYKPDSVEAFYQFNKGLYHRVRNPEAA